MAKQQLGAAGFAGPHPHDLTFAAFRRDLVFHLCAHVCHGFLVKKERRKPSALTLRYATHRWEGFPTRWPVFRAMLAQWVPIGGQAVNETLNMLVRLLEEEGLFKGGRNTGRRGSVSLAADKWKSKSARRSASSPATTAGSARV